jgi:hypothetical protein
LGGRYAGGWVGWFVGRKVELLVGGWVVGR